MKFFNFVTLNAPCLHASPNVFRGGEDHSHIFLHCNLARRMLTNLMRLFGLIWVMPATMESLFIFFEIRSDVYATMESFICSNIFWVGES